MRLEVGANEVARLKLSGSYSRGWRLELLGWRLELTRLEVGASRSSRLELEVGGWSWRLEVGALRLEVGALGAPGWSSEVGG